ncbi:MAG: hypothetical protein J2O48_04390 [Solirubrobacterales bacterium]|nr:hypothetical protein [Solirubrobacterales bacterium]
MKLAVGRPGAALAVLASSAALVAGCGSSSSSSTTNASKGSSPSSSSSSSSDATAVNAALKTYLTAIQKGDGTAACGVLTPSLQKKMLAKVKQAEPSATSCPKVFAIIPAQVRKVMSKVQVGTPKVSGSTATGELTAAGKHFPVQLTKSGGKWQISGDPSIGE